MRYLILLTAILLTSCVSYPRQVESVELAYEAKFPLLKDNNWASFSALHEITVKEKEQTYSFKVQVEVFENQITIIGLTPVHSRSFLISSKNGIINYEEHPYFRYPVEPEKMIIDIIMVHCPLHLLKENLRNTDITVEHKKDLRVFKKDSKELTKIKYSKNQFLINHSESPFSIEIKVLDFEKL